jgi:hypothetical protein
MPIDRVAAYRRFRAVLGAIALAAMLGAATAAAQTPAKARALALRYDVFIGGVYVITFDATVGLDRSGYSARAEGGTRGSIAQLFPWNTTLSSRGKLGALTPTPNAFAPERFDDVSEWQGKTRRTTLRFTGRGRYVVEHDPAEPPSAESDADEGVLPASLPSGAMDPFAAAVAALSASAQDGACARHIPVFDGKRRYDLIVRDGDGEVNLPPSPVSAYTGPALSCRIGIKRISGYGKRRANHYWDETSTNPPTIWAADLAPGMPLVPVKLMATVVFGTMSANLVHAEVRENGATRTLADLKR